jgi:hypothetical protein
MRKAASKALYLFLCSILGMVLFAMLHRAIFVLYDLLLVMDYDTYSLGLTADGIMALDYITLLVALFFGGWYGTLLGMDWYSIVYGPNAVKRPAGMFHGFVPHNWRHGRKAVTKSVSSAKAAATNVFTPVTVPVVSKIKEWSFEDLIATKPAPKKKAVAKRATTRKTVRKSTAKRTVKSEA